MAAAEDLAACRALMRRHSRPFFIASRCMPPRVRDPATALYAFCQSLRESVEDREPPPTAGRDVKERVLSALRGQPAEGPTDRAFCRVVRDQAIPSVLFEAFGEGLAWDAEGRRYATDSGLFDYCVRVAGSLAAAVCVVMGRRKAVVIERAFDLGVAMQLTKIARDVGYDARRGRVYLPIEWLEEAGVDADSMLETRQATPAIKSVIRRVLQTADAFYSRADPGIGALPFDCRPAVRGIRYIYASIAHEVESRDYDSISHAASVPIHHIVRLLARAVRSPRSESRPLEAQPLREAEAIVRAMTSS